MARSSVWAGCREGQARRRRKDARCTQGGRGSGAEVSHYIFTSIDISDRKRSEQRIRFLAEHDVLDLDNAGGNAVGGIEEGVEVGFGFQRPGVQR